MSRPLQKALSLALSLAMLLGTIPEAVFAAKEEVTQSSGASPTPILSIGVSGITDSGATLEFISDQDGYVYYLVQEASKDEPDVDRIKSAESAAVSATAYTAVDAEGLLSDTAYTVYGIMVAKGGLPEERIATDSDAERLECTTGGESVCVIASQSFTTKGKLNVPAVSFIAAQFTADGVELTFEADQDGTYYCLIDEAEADVPDAAAMKAQGESAAKANGAVVSGSAITVSITAELDVEKQYSAYLLAENTDGLLSEVQALPIIAQTMMLRGALAEGEPDTSWYDADKWAFEIGTAEQLRGLADIVNGNYGEAANFWGKTITLTADLDLSAYDNWTPIGTSTDKPFFGTFEGGKHTISNLTIDAPEAEYIGLFGMVKGTVKDVILMDPDITGLKSVGGIAGEIWNNVLNHCAVVGGRVTGHENVGGVVGRVAYDPAIINTPSNESRIERCFATCDVIGTGTWPQYAGGVAGIVEYGNVLNCYATGTVRSPDGSGSYNRFYSVGGVVGRGYCASIIGCYAMGDVVATLSIGGIVGTMGGVSARQSRLENCIALNGMVSGNLDWYGGPKVGRVVGEHSYTGITNIWASKTMARLGDGGSHGPDITPEELQTQEKFISNGFPAAAWIGEVGNLAILADFTEGLQSAQIPWHIISSAPSAPRNVTGVNGDQTVTLSWLAPAYAGASAITRYEVRKNSEDWLSAGMSTSYTFTGLTNDTAYTFAVRAVNDHGEGREVSLEKTPGTPPGAVQNPIVVYEGNNLILYWEKPAGTVNEDAVYYQTRYWYEIPMWEDRPWDSVDYRSYFKGYTNISGNVTYTLQIRAGNAHGLGSVTEITGSRDSYPTPPKAVTATAGNGQVTLNWSAPDYQGASAITSYQVFNPVSKTWSSAGMATSYTVTGLTNGLSYRFFVRAINSGGNGTSATLIAKPLASPVITSDNSYSRAYGAGGSFQVQATGTAPLAFSLTGAPSGVTMDSAGLISISETVPAGSYPFTVKVSNGASADATQNFTLTINKANNTLSISCPNITYGASPVPSVVSNVSGGAVTYAYKVQEAADSTYTATVPTGARSYTVRGTSAATANYNAATATANFTISKANNTLSISCANILYGAAPAPFAVTNTGGGAVAYVYKAQGADDGAYTATIPTAVGSYTVRGTSAATANYNAATATANFTISKANNTLSISCANITYGQTPAPSVVTNKSGGAVTYAYKVQEAADGAYAATVPTAVGSYTVRGTSAATANYNAAIATANFTIGKANSTLSISCADITYGAAPAPSVVSNVSGGLVTYAYKVQEADDSTYTATAPTGAGSYTVRGTSAATANYNAAIATANFTIGKAESILSISCSNITYGEAPAPSVVSNASGGAVTYAYKVQEADDSTYTATIPTGAGSYTVRGTSAATANYNAATATANFTIGKANSTLSISCADITYGAAPTPSVVTNTSSGMVTYAYKEQSADDSTYTVTVPEQTGDYTVRGTSAATANYNAATGTADFTIGKATPSLTLTADPVSPRARPGSVALAAALPGDATGTLTFLAGTDVIKAVPLPVKTASFTPTTATNAYGFTVEYSGDGNYSSAASAPLDYIFIKSDQSALNAEDGASSYGSTLELSLLVSGGSGAGTISFAVTNGPGEINGTTLIPTGAGEVDMTVTKAADNDYNAQSAAFKVTVNPRVIAFKVAPVSAQTYTGSAVTPTPEVQDGSIVLTEGVHFTYSYLSNTDVGTSAAVHITGIGSYEGSTGSVAFTIGGAAPTVITPPAVGGIIYAGTALSHITLTGGEASVGGHFEWADPSATAVYGANAFEVRFVPDNPVLYTQISGINITFSAINRPSGGGDSSLWGTTIIPGEKPNQPIVAGVAVTTQVTNGTANANIPDKSIADAIAKAQAEAKAQGKTKNGIAVAINVTLPQGAAALSIILSQSALQSLVNAGVASLTINSAPLPSVSFDLKALKEIQKQSRDNVSIRISPATSLSSGAKRLIGERPVYDIAVTYVKRGKVRTITSLGKGTVTAALPYVLASGETAAGLYGAVLDSKGRATRIKGAAYDPVRGCMVFAAGKLWAAYSVGYTAPRAGR